jgi:hypothetical protein
MRRNPTLSEMALWQNLKGKKLLGFWFLRRHLIHYQVVGQEYFFMWLIFIAIVPARASRSIKYNSLAGAPPLPILGRGRGGYNFDLFT